MPYVFQDVSRKGMQKLGIMRKTFVGYINFLRKQISQ